MKNIVKIFPFLVLIAYIAMSNRNIHSPELMRIPSLICLLLIATILTFLARYIAVSPIDFAIGLYLTFGALTYWLFPENLGIVVSSYSVSLLYIVFFMMAVLPPLFGKKPFTEFFSRQSAPSELIGTPVFNIINRHLTLAWAGIFLASAFAASMPNVFPDLNTRLIGLLFRTGMPLAISLGVGMPLVKYYPDYYQRKYSVQAN